MNAALPLKHNKVQASLCSIRAGCRKVVDATFAAGAVDWRLEAPALCPGPEYFAWKVSHHVCFQQTRAKLLLFEIIFCVSHCFPRACQQEHRGGFPEVKTTKLPESLYWQWKGYSTVGFDKCDPFRRPLLSSQCDGPGAVCQTEPWKVKDA